MVMRTPQLMGLAVAIAFTAVGLVSASGEGPLAHPPRWELSCARGGCTPYGPGVPGKDCADTNTTCPTYTLKCGGGLCPMGSPPGTACSSESCQDATVNRDCVAPDGGIFHHDCEHCAGHLCEAVYCYCTPLLPGTSTVCSTKSTPSPWSPCGVVGVCQY